MPSVFLLPRLGRIGFLLILALLTSGIASKAHAHSPQVIPGVSPAQDVVAMPASGLETALGNLPELIEATRQRSGVPGIAVAVVQADKTLFAQGFGVRELGKPQPIDTDTVFQIASISKPLTASIIATQITQGKVNWDDPVQRHLPDFRLSNPYVTAHANIGDFMAHRSGLPGAAGDDLESLGFERAQILERLQLLPLDTFRTSYHYANFGTTIAAEAVAAAVGTPWETLAEQALFKPLGMTSTSMRHTDFLAHDNRALLHTLANGKFQALFDRNPDAQAPAGGVSSSVSDMASWLKFLLAQGQHEGKALASSESLLAAVSPQAFSNQPANQTSRPGFYGYGFNVGNHANGRNWYSHSGAFLLGASTHFQVLPSANLAIVVLSNGSPTGAAESIAMNFMDTVQYGKPLRDWYEAYNTLMQSLYTPVGDLSDKSAPPRPEPAQALENYTGSYQNPYFGNALVLHESGKLILALGPDKTRYPLTHWDGDTFYMIPIGEDAPANSRSSVTFSMTQSASTGFTIDYLNDHAQGSWTR